MQRRQRRRREANRNSRLPASEMSTASATTIQPVSTIVSEGVWLTGKLDLGAFASLEDAYGCAPSGRKSVRLFPPSSNPSPRVPKCKLPLKALLAPRLETITTVSAPYTGECWLLLWPKSLAPTGTPVSHLIQIWASVLVTILTSPKSCPFSAIQRESKNTLRAGFSLVIPS